jgi:YcxB-like protein
MTIQYTITLDDLIAFNIYVAAPMLKRSMLNSLIGAILVFVVTVYVNFDFWLFATIWLVLVFVYAKFGTIYFFKRRAAKLLNDSVVLGEHTLIIDDAGIQDIQKLGKEELNWSGVQKIEDDENYIYIFIGQIRAYVIPKRCFAYPDQADAFCIKAIALWKGVEPKP